ncbi:MAG: ATP-binding protein [Lachnospiraceae bacterium]|nr:ATP-binding protein [Lachnospiraceae bacterium]
MRELTELLLFRETGEHRLLDDFHLAVRDSWEGAHAAAGRLLRGLAAMAGETGFYGNLWHDYLTSILVSDENSYSLSAERRGAPDGTVRGFALHDMAIFREWFDADLTELARKTGVPELSAAADYRADSYEGKIYSRRVRTAICELSLELAQAEDPERMLNALEIFYRRIGVGTIGLHKAFRLRERDGRLQIEPVTQIADVRLDDLVGYERAKQLLVDNTEAFLCGAPANNCLLYGDAGTGKSSSVKALANTYYDRGLRIIEVYRHELRYLHELIGRIKRRNYRFLLYMDDLSFEEFETDYKYLKAVIEGGLEKKPDNVLIYATSNRRHLIRESFSDKAKLSDDDVHRSDTVQEKLSLFDRFGLTIYYGAPTPLEYREIVRVLAEREGVRLSGEELLAEANRWQLKHAGYSGRTARQLIDDLVGKEVLAGTRPGEEQHV